MHGLFQSRKFWLALIAEVVAAVLFIRGQATVDQFVDATVALVGVLIASIALEDAGANMAAPQLTGTISPAGKIEAEKQAGLVPPASEGEKERGD